MEPVLVKLKSKKKIVLYVLKSKRIHSILSRKKSPQCPGGVQILERRQIAANHLSRGDGTLQSALVFSSGSSVPESRMTKNKKSHSIVCLKKLNKVIV